MRCYLPDPESEQELAICEFFSYSNRRSRVFEDKKNSPVFRKVSTPNTIAAQIYASQADPPKNPYWLSNCWRGSPKILDSSSGSSNSSAESTENLK
jgi:hypothetical protein